MNALLNSTIVPQSFTTISTLSSILTATSSKNNTISQHLPKIISTTFQALNVTFPNHTFSSVHPSPTTPAHTKLPTSFVFVSFILILTYICLVTYSVVNFCRQAASSSGRRLSATYMPFRNETPFLYGGGGGSSNVEDSSLLEQTPGSSHPFLYRSADGSLSSR